MAETIFSPLESDGEDPLGDFDFNGFDEGNPDSLNALIASLTETDEDKVGFGDLSVASPYGRFSWRSRPFMRSELQLENTDSIAETRKELASEMRYRYGDQEVVDDAKIITSELATNALIHGGCEERDVAVAGIFRARTIRGGVVFEAANVSDETVDTQAATERGSHESGNGFEIIRALAEEHGGEVGRYKVVTGWFGREKIVADPAQIDRVRGRWVVWATFMSKEDSRQMLAA